MNIAEFKISLQNPHPPTQIPDLLKSLWFDAKGDWEKAHQIAQEKETPDYCLIHAYLHRVEGDEWNAGYWYKKAKREFPKLTLAEEWEKLTLEFLK